MFNPYAIAMNKRGQYDFEKKAKEKISGSVEMTAPNISSSSEGNTSPQSEKKINIDLQNFVPSVINPEITAPVIDRIEPVEIEFDQNLVTRNDGINEANVLATFLKTSAEKAVIKQPEPVYYNPAPVSTPPDSPVVSAQVVVPMSSSNNSTVVSNTDSMPSPATYASTDLPCKIFADKLNLAGHLIADKTAQYKSEKKINLSPDEKTIIFDVLCDVQDLKKVFERGSEERKKLNLAIGEINKIIQLLPAQEKNVLIDELYGLNGYASDDDEKGFNYEKHFKAKDLLRLANAKKSAGINGQMQTIFDSVTALEKQITELQEKKRKFAKDHSELQKKYDLIENINAIFYALQLKDHQALLLAKEEATQNVKTLKDEITTLEKSYANEKDVKLKVTLLSTLNERRKTAATEITQNETIIATLNSDLTRMEKRLYPDQNNNNTSYLSLSGLTGYFWGSKQAQPTLEDKK